MKDTYPTIDYKRREKMNQHFGHKYLLSPWGALDPEVGAWSASVKKTDPFSRGTHGLLIS